MRGCVPACLRTAHGTLCSRTHAACRHTLPLAGIQVAVKKLKEAPQTADVSCDSTFAFLKGPEQGMRRAAAWVS